jgi:1,4-dihydroxy-2-naphthoate octaprenyltransferase
MILGVVLFKSLPSWVLLGLLTVPLAFGAAKGAAQYANDTRHLIPSLGKNVTINLLTPLLMAVGLWIAAAG